MTREVLSNWVTLPVYRDTILLSCLEKGRGGGDGWRRKAGKEKKGQIEKRREKKGRSKEEKMGKHEKEGVGSKFDSKCC